MRVIAICSVTARSIKERFPWFSGGNNHRVSFIPRPTTVFADCADEHGPLDLSSLKVYYAHTVRTIPFPLRRVSYYSVDVYRNFEVPRFKNYQISIECSCRYYTSIVYLILCAGFDSLPLILIE